MQLSELLNLQNLAQGKQQTVLLELAVTQRNLASAGERISIVRFSCGFEASFEFTLHHAFGAAGFGNNLIGLDVLKRHTYRERRVFRLRLHREMAADVAAAGMRRDFRKVQFFWIITKRRFQSLEEKPIAQG